MVFHGFQDVVNAFQTLLFHELGGNGFDTTPNALDQKRILGFEKFFGVFKSRVHLTQDVIIVNPKCIFDFKFVFHQTSLCLALLLVRGKAITRSAGLVRTLLWLNYHWLGSQKFLSPHYIPENRGFVNLF